MEDPEGHGVQEVGFITVQMTKPSVLGCMQTALRLQEGIDAVPSGECPPHSGDKAPCVWDFLGDDFSRLLQAGALICLKAWLIGPEQLFMGWVWGLQAGLGKPGAWHSEGKKDPPVQRGVRTTVAAAEVIWVVTPRVVAFHSIQEGKGLLLCELVSIPCVLCQAWNWRPVHTLPQLYAPWRIVQMVSSPSLSCHKIHQHTGPLPFAKRNKQTIRQK